MALALEVAMLQKVTAEQAAASTAERQAIAHNLHDTLAQNIGYLRLKLDQLTGVHVIREISAVLQELERMRAIADEAYQQVRNTLDELNPIRGENLSSTLFKQAQSISQRAGFQLRTSQVGTPHPLSNYIREQILFIVREALYNIEKHAIANQAYLHLIWLEAELIIKIADDGVGFNPLATPVEGHYGLWIMQQRALEIGGSLKISPASTGIIVDSANGNQQESTDFSGSAGKPGTEVTLWVPLTAAQETACTS
jgi:two-component system nitrate/nitrite sensor histidine kinase NarX